MPINNLMRVEGTPLADAEPLDPFEFVRTIAAVSYTHLDVYKRQAYDRASENDA